MLLLFLCACSDDEEPSNCNAYFLKTVDGPGDGDTNFFYNEDGLISAMVSGPSQGRTQFVYGSNNKLAKVSDSGSDTEFIHDGSGRLVATMRFNGSERLDSLVFEYDVSQRIVKRSIYKGQPGSAFLHSYYTVAYPSPGALKVDFYNQVLFETEYEYSGSFLYTTDDKHSPFPEEYRSLYLSWTNVSTPNNFTSLQTSNKDGLTNFTTTYEYSYNSGGYPLTEAAAGVTMYRYTYACEPPRE